MRLLSSFCLGVESFSPAVLQGLALVWLLLSVL